MDRLLVIPRQIQTLTLGHEKAWEQEGKEGNPKAHGEITLRPQLPYGPHINWQCQRLRGEY